MRHHHTRSVLAALPLLLAALACSDSTSPEPTPVGTYALVTVDGDPIPFVVAQTGSDKLELTDGRLTLNGDGTCSVSITARRTQDGQTSTNTDGDTCTWTNNNNALTLTYSSGSSDVGSWSGDQISLTSDGHVFLFER